MEEASVERNRKSKNKKRGLKEQVPKSHRRLKSRQGRDEDALILSDELDAELASEFPGLNVEKKSVLLREEEEAIEDELDSLEKMVDPVRIYLKEMGSFPLLTREGEVKIAKRIESEQREVLSVVLNCPIAIQEVINLGTALHAGKTTIKEVTNEIDDDEGSVEEEKIRKKKVL